MKSVLLALILFGSQGGSAWADPWEELGRRFTQGELPAREDVVGWRSGRCYRSGRPDRPENFLLIGHIEWQGPDAGPLFPRREVLKVAEIQRKAEAPELFDTLEESRALEIEQFLGGPKGWSRLPEIREENGAFRNDPTVVWDRFTEIRKSGDYLVLRLVQRDEVEAYCYTFKKVR